MTTRKPRARARKPKAHDPIYDDEPQASQLARMGLQSIRDAERARARKPKAKAAAEPPPAPQAMSAERAKPKPKGCDCGNLREPHVRRFPSGIYCVECDCGRTRYRADSDTAEKAIAAWNSDAHSPGPAAPMSAEYLEETRGFLQSHGISMARATKLLAEIDRLRAEVAAKDAEIARLKALQQSTADYWRGRFEEMQKERKPHD